MTAPSEKLVLGFDLGGTSMAAGLVDGRLSVLDTLQSPTPTGSRDELLSGILDLVEPLIDRAPAPVAAAGFGIPSLINQARGRVVMSVNVPIEDFDFAGYMSQRLALPVFIDNDANVAALAEVRAGAASGAREVVMITMGTGIGGGIITGGRVYRGATGSAAELGHMVIEANGLPCHCGNRGCFETMASGTALKRYAKELAAQEPDSALAAAAASGRELEGGLVYRLAGEGDAAAQRVFERIGFYLGVGITSLVNIFNPEVFVVGGGLMQAGDLIMAPARELLEGRGLKPNRDVVRVTTARFGPEAGLIGAACLALEESASL